jgi:hypothetical protein
MSLRALHPIKANEEINISYIGQLSLLHISLLFSPLTISDVNFPTSVRQAKLVEQYHFTCTCKRCVQNWNVHSAARWNPVLALDIPAIIEMEIIREKVQTLAANPLPEYPLADHLTVQQSGHLFSTGMRTHPANISIYPFFQILHSYSEKFIAARNYASAIIIRIALIFFADPFVYPEPFHPDRMTSIYTLIKLVSTEDPRHSLPALGIIPSHLLNQIDWPAALLSLLTLLAAHMDKSHGDHSRFAREVAAVYAESLTIPDELQTPAVRTFLHGTDDLEIHVTALRLWRQLGELGEMQFLTKVVMAGAAAMGDVVN